MSVFDKNGSNKFRRGFRAPFQQLGSHLLGRKTSRFNPEETTNDLTDQYSGALDATQLRSLGTTIGQGLSLGLSSRFAKEKDNEEGIPGLAKGGKAKSNQPYLVGEEGPELMMPDGSGTVIPAHELALLSPETIKALGVEPRSGLDGQRRYGEDAARKAAETARLRSRLGTKLAGQESGFPKTDKWASGADNYKTQGSKLAKSAGNVAKNVAGKAGGVATSLGRALVSPEGLYSAADAYNQYQLENDIKSGDVGLDTAVRGVASLGTRIPQILGDVSGGIDFQNSPAGKLYNSAKSNLTDYLESTDPQGLFSKQEKQTKKPVTASQTKKPAQIEQTGSSFTPFNWNGTEVLSREEALGLGMDPNDIAKIQADKPDFVAENSIQQKSQPSSDRKLPATATQQSYLDPKLKALYDPQNPNAGSLASRNYNKANDIRDWKGNSMPGVIEQQGAYSPADTHARQEYLNYRDSDQNQTTIQSGDMNRYVENGAIEWDMNDQMAALTPQQRQLVRMNRMIQEQGGNELGKDTFDPYGQEKLNILKQEADTNYIDATQPKYSAKAVNQYNDMGEIIGQELQQFQTQGKRVGDQSLGNIQQNNGLKVIGTSKGRPVYEDAQGNRFQ